MPTSPKALSRESLGNRELILKKYFEIYHAWQLSKEHPFFSAAARGVIIIIVVSKGQWNFKVFTNADNLLKAVESKSYTVKHLLSQL